MSLAVVAGEVVAQRVENLGDEGVVAVRVSRPATANDAGPAAAGNALMLVWAFGVAAGRNFVRRGRAEHRRR